MNSVTGLPSRNQQIASPISSQTLYPAQSVTKVDDSALDKFARGVTNTAISVIPGIGGFVGLRPLAFQIGWKGDADGARKMDAATLANYASVPLLLSAIAFPTVGLVGAGLCLAASGVAGLWGSLKTS